MGILVGHKQCDTFEKMLMLNFPLEVLEEIIAVLPPKDVKSISLTCKLFNEITKSDQLWSRVCWNHYKLRISSNRGEARVFCQRVLHKYGHLFGLWKVHADCYGGLLKIEVTHFIQIKYIIHSNFFHLNF